MKLETHERMELPVNNPRIDNVRRMKPFVATPMTKREIWIRKLVSSGFEPETARYFVAVWEREPQPLIDSLRDAAQ